MNNLTQNTIEMKHRTKNLIALTGVIFSVVGIIISIPSFIKEQYVTAIISVIMVVLGLVLLAIAFGE